MSKIKTLAEDISQRLHQANEEIRTVSVEEYTENAYEILEEWNGRTLEIIDSTGKVLGVMRQWTSESKDDPHDIISKKADGRRKAEKEGPTEASKTVPPAPKDQPILSDTCRDTLNHTIEGIDLDSVKYYETDDDEKSITIIIKGSFEDEEKTKDFMHGTHKSEYDAYDRAMKGI